MSSNYNYAASLAAFRNACDNVIFEHMATVFTAGSDEEAQAYADAIAHEAYVDEAGWTGHQAMILKITGTPNGSVDTLTIGDETVAIAKLL